MCNLAWGTKKPLKQLDLEQKPDVILASDVVYGNDPEKWRDLLWTLKKLSGPHTLAILANMQRYPVKHALSEASFLQAELAKVRHMLDTYSITQQTLVYSDLA